MARNKKKLVDSFAALVHSPKLRLADLPSPTPSQVLIDERIIDMPTWHLRDRAVSGDASLPDTIILDNTIDTEVPDKKLPTVKKRKRGVSTQTKEGESSGSKHTAVKRRTMTGMGGIIDGMSDDLERTRQQLLAEQVSFQAQRQAFEEARAAFETSEARLTQKIIEIEEDRAHVQGSVDRIEERWMGPARKLD